jgi:L-asparaginase II
MVPLRSGVPLIEVTRSGVVESLHRGHLVVLDGVGAVAEALGTPAQPVFPRSANKPLQAVGMRELGLTVATDELALAAASHSGEPKHVAVVLRTLAAGDLTEDDLGCPAEWPLGADAAEDWIAAGGGRTRLRMNCSGKHAAMLRTCQANGWPTHGYLAADHPLQQHLQRTVARMAGEPVAAVGVDGCGAPLYAITLLGLAAAFAALGAATAGAPAEVAAAMRDHPDLVGGTGRLVTRLMSEVPGLVAKEGAEGVYAATLPGTGTVVVKVDDGAQRAAECAVVAGLRRLDIVDDAFAERVVAPVLGGGERIGHVRARRDLFAR